MQELKFFNKRFEDVVRHELVIYDRPITDVDALLVCDLDCSQFTFDAEDCGTLCAFKNLDWLDINVGFENLSFFKNLQNLEELFIEFHQDCFNFSYLTGLKKLTSLTVSGGDLSDFKLDNLGALSKLPELEDLGLHEFGSVDLSELKNLTRLKGFFCAYGNDVKNIEAISYLTNLEALTLLDIKINNFDFLKPLSGDVIINLNGIIVLENIDIDGFKRFKECSIEESFINDEKISWRVYNESD